MGNRGLKTRRKRRRRKPPPATTVGVQRKSVKDNNSKDKLSELSDDVLETILSLLTMKEMARTSILSRRWRNLWTFISDLNFDATEALSSIVWKPKVVERAKGSYIDWVFSVLDLHQGPTIHQFSVGFPLDASNTDGIDEWIRFAIEKKVECLKMHFEFDLNYVSCCTVIPYSFPPLGIFSGYMSLRKLDLKNVDIGEDAIQHFLSSCSHLEYLAIEDSKHLFSLNVAGQSLCLRHLAIVSCYYLSSIRLSAPNLSSFGCYARPHRFSFGFYPRMIDISYAHVPNLVDVSLGDFKHIIHNLPHLSNHVACLETLTLRMKYLQQSRSLVEYPELPYLKNLKLDVCVRDNDESILAFAAPLIKRAPSLHKLVLELSWDCGGKYRNGINTLKSLHHCLKEVEIAGFVGANIDMEFAMYLLENAVALEKITLDCMTPATKDHGISVPLKRRKFAMRQAMLLESKFSLGDKLVTRIF